MVAITRSFTSLAVLSSLAVVSVLPPTVSGAAVINVTDPHVVARHSLNHEHTAQAALSAADVGDSDVGDDDTSSASPSKHDSDKKRPVPSKKSTPSKNKETPQGRKQERHPKPVVPLPFNMKKSTKSAASDESGEKKNHSATKDTHAKEARDAWSLDPMTRMRTLWVGARDVSVLEVQEGRLDRRHHDHHDHHDHHEHHDHDKVIVSGNDDHVNVHERSVPSPNFARSPHSDGHDRVVVTGDNDHVHFHDDDRHDDDHRERVVVKGDNDHVHFHRSPSPDPHPDDLNVDLEGDRNNIRVHHRSPHPDDLDVDLEGDRDNIRVHHRSPYHHRHQGHKGRMHVIGRSPHHHDHHKEKVVVSGDHDHVRVDRRQASKTRINEARGFILFPGDHGVYHYDPQSHYGPSDPALIVGVNLRRDSQNSGVPGTVDIMSAVANSDQGAKVASLVIATSNNTDASPSPFVLNASDKGTQMYLVALPSSSVAAVTGAPSQRQVLLQMPVFDAESAQMTSYCATFDPRPSAPSPMTVESCMDNPSGDEHKSQVFAYEPDTGIIQPTWYQGEEDGTGDDRPSPPAGDPDDGTGSSNGTDSTVDPPTPASDRIASVTSFDQEAVDEQYGDATRPPTKLSMAKTFTTESSGSAAEARNVTLFFTPAAPVVGRVASNSSAASTSTSSVDSVTSSSTGSATSSAATIASAVTTSDSSFSSSTTSITDNATSTATSADALTASETSTTASTSTVTSTDVSTPDPSMTTSSDTSTATSTNSSSDSVATSSASDSSAAEATSSPALEVKVYNPDSSSSSSTTSSTTDAGTTSATTSSASSVTMTPVSTAPYQWMFNARRQA